MPNYRRAFVPGGTFFLTAVVRGRRQVLTRPEYREALSDAFRTTRARRPFTCKAIVLLPDHWHAIVTLPADDADFSMRMHAIKRRTVLLTDDRVLWQKRFWEHTVRDEHEYERLAEYIHFNPVKHGVAACPHAWPYSSFHRFVRSGMYAIDWGCSCEGREVDDPTDQVVAKITGE